MLRVLMFKHEDLSSDPQIRSQAQKPAKESIRDKMIPEAHWSVILDELMSFRLGKRPCLKKWINGSGVKSM